LAGGQLEQSRFMTPYVNNTRSITESLFDLTANTTPSLTSLTYNSAGFEFVAESFDMITVPHNTSIALSTEFTSEMWVWAESSQNSTFPMLWNKTNTLVHIAQTSPFNVTQNVSTGGPLRQVSAAGALVHSTWTHIATTYDGRVSRIYRNGILVNSTDFGSIVNISASSSDLRIGRHSSPIHHFNGKIEAFKLYTRALSAAEILQNFEAHRGRFGI